MINISLLEVSGIKGAIHGMRLPFKAEDKSDSFERIFLDECDNFEKQVYHIGPKDLELCQKLIRSDGDDHSKFMRMIHVQADVDAPLYWWKEFDTYKVATVANSESTMHTIMKHEFTKDDFSFDIPAGLLEESSIDRVEIAEYLEDTFNRLNGLRGVYLRYKDSNSKSAALAWRILIQILPESYMQKRTIDLNYQTLRRIYFARKGHKLVEWHKFCDWIKTLPYAEELITYDPCNVQKVGGSDASN